MEKILQVSLRVQLVKNSLTSVLGFFSVIITTAFLYRKFFTESILVGEPFDTRLIVIIHEHWFKFLTGSNSFLDIKFFFPYEKSLAFSDTFLLTGLTHSVFRLLNFDIVDAWNLTQILWTAIGLLGWLLLGRKFIKNKILIISFPLLIGTTFAFKAYLNERPNVITYLFISWIFLFIVNFFKENQNKNFNSLNLGSALISFPLLVLTSWYPGFFVIIFVVCLFIILVLFSSKFRKKLFFSLSQLNYFVMMPFVFIAIFLSALWAYIYLPILRSVAESGRSLDEVIMTSPTVGQVFSTNALNGALLNFGVEQEYILGDQAQIGFSILILSILFFLLLPILVFQKIAIGDLRYQILLATLGIVALFEVVIVKFVNDRSFFMTLWENFAFVRSIRNPVRWHVFATFFIIVCIIFILDDIVFKQTKLKNVLPLVIVTLILIDQYRIAPGLWVKEEFIDKELLSYTDSIGPCDAYVLDRPNFAYWRDVINSIALTTLLNKPTVNGYSGGFPENYPGISWYSEGDLNALGNWISDYPELEKICLLDGINLQEPLFYNSGEVELVLGNGFTSTETDGVNSWFWSVWDSSEFYLYNLNPREQNLRLNFDFNSPSCLLSSSYEIQIGEKNFNLDLIKTNKLLLEQQINIQPWDRISIRVNSKQESCTFEGDPRTLFYSIKNLSTTFLD